MHYIYIIQCKDGSLYTGYTNDIEKRIKTHNEKKGAKYTRGRTPVTLKYFEAYEDKQDALKRENEIKSLPREKKFLLFNKTVEN